MIKCFIVKSKCNIIEKQTRGGVFIKNKAYVAKMSNNSPNTISILDEKYNWVPYNYIKDSYVGCLLYFKHRFRVQETFYVENKRVLNSLFPVHFGWMMSDLATSNENVNRTMRYGEGIGKIMMELEEHKLICGYNRQNKIPCVIKQINIEK